MKRRAILILALAMLATVSATAQVKTSLTIQSNQTGAQIYLNDRLVGFTSPSFTLLVDQGKYVVRVVMDGYPDFKTTVTVGASPVTVQAMFGGVTTTVPKPKPPSPPPTLPPPLPPPPPQPQRFQLTVGSNLSNALVYLNNAFVGTTPLTTTVTPGFYSLVVRMTGYAEYRQQVTVNGHVSIYATMYPLNHDVFIDTPGLRGAQVYRNSIWVGTTPYRDTWEPGYYSIAIKATGYTDYQESFSLTGPKTIQASLVPALVPYEIRLPDSFTNKELRGAHWNQIRMLIDGQPVYSNFGQLTPGMHTFTFITGGIAFESSFNVQPGKPCIIEPAFTVNVIQ